MCWHREQCQACVGGLGQIACRTVDDDAVDSAGGGGTGEQAAPAGAVGPSLVGDDDDMSGPDALTAAVPRCREAVDGFLGGRSEQHGHGAAGQ